MHRIVLSKSPKCRKVLLKVLDVILKTVTGEVEGIKKKYKPRLSRTGKDTFSLLYGNSKHTLELYLETVSDDLCGFCAKGSLWSPREKDFISLVMEGSGRSLVIDEDDFQIALRGLLDRCYGFSKGGVETDLSFL